MCSGWSTKRDRTPGRLDAAADCDEDVDSLVGTFFEAERTRSHGDQFPAFAMELIETAAEYAAADELSTVLVASGLAPSQQDSYQYEHDDHGRFEVLM